MIKLSDTVDNTKIVYLYVKEFEWTFPEGKENNVGHPKKNKVYRAAYNSDTNSYRLFYEFDKKFTALFLPTLTAVNNETFFDTPTYTSEIVELSRHNVLEHLISEEDLDDWLKWIEEDNASIKQMMGLDNNQSQGKQPQIVTAQDVVRAVQKNQENQELTQFLSRLEHLREINPPLFEALTNLVEFLVGPPDGPELDTMVETDWIGFSKTLGAGKNLSDALKQLSRYGGESRRTNLMERDLFGAIRSLLAEQARRNFHGIANDE